MITQPNLYKKLKTYIVKYCVQSYSQENNDSE